MASIWTSLVTPGVVAAAVTLLANWWLLRARASLRMSPSGQTVEDLERLKRAEYRASEQERSRSVTQVVRLTNYGDGTAYDIELTGRNCRPRVWLSDGGKIEAEGADPELAWPIWGRRLAALKSGESVQVFLMCVMDERNYAEVTATWSDMPGRSRRRSTRFAVKDDLKVESGWPGSNPEL